jgi:CRISPR-associated protein Csx10
MKALIFTVELLQPLLSTGLEGDANIGISMNYIAGSVLRGTIIKISQKKNDIALTERDLFFNGKVKFQNAYPLIKVRDNYQRSLPVPLSWQREKDEKEEDGTFIKDFSNTAKLKDHKPLSNPFFAFKRNNIILKNLDTRLAIHTTRNVEKGRSDEDEGAVFRYESIVEGTKFSGAIISQYDNCLNQIKGWIDGKEVLLGGSRNSGYGKAKIVCDDEIKNWKELQTTDATEIAQNTGFLITLLSNALVRDANGHLQTDLIAQSLGLNDSDISLIADSTFKRGELVGGFNRKWGLPLPQMLSIKAGSVFKFQANTKIEISKVETWIKNGIGERTLDGFGQIAVNMNTSDSYQIAKESDSEIPQISFSSQAKAVGESLAKNIVKKRLESDLNSKILKYKIEGRISNSQISRLRLHIREMLRGEKDSFTAFFDSLKNTAKNQLEETTKVTGEKHSGRLKKWIEEVFTHQDIISTGKVSFGDTNKAEADGENFKKEFHLRLIDGVLARKAKEVRQND